MGDGYEQEIRDMAGLAAVVLGKGHLGYDRFDRWVAQVRAEAFSEGVNFIDGQSGPWGACVVAGRAEAARRLAAAANVEDV